MMDGPMKNNKWACLLAYVTGLVNQKLLLQNEYLAAENRILRALLPARLPLSDPQRSTLAEIGKRLGRRALAEVVCVAKPETILAWYRKLVAQKFDVPHNVRTRVGRQLDGRLRNWLSRWRERTRAGAMTASSEHCPTSVILFRIRLWVTFCAGTASHRHPRDPVNPERIGTVHGRGYKYVTKKREGQDPVRTPRDSHGSTG
jgi:hypothetical protein